MGSGGSKKLRSISVSTVDKKTQDSLKYPRSRSVPSNLGSQKQRHLSAPENGFFSRHIEDKMEGNDLKEFVFHVQKEQALLVPTNVKPPEKVGTNGLPVGDSEWTVTELYNILIAESWLGKAQLHRLNYLLLIDCRNEEEYKECHVVTAKHHSCLTSEFGCLLEIPRQLESFDMIVLYNDDNGYVGKSLQARNVSFCMLNSAFETFYRKYPFLCTSEIVATVEQRTKSVKTWPSEVLEGQLYQSAAIHVTDRDIMEKLGITHILNITLDKPNSFPDTIKYMTIRLKDESDVNLSSWIPKSAKFISDALSSTPKDGQNRVLVHCNLGRSRSSTIVIGYLMESKHWSLKDAYNWLKDCRPTVQPNIGFLDQLVNYEVKVFGKKLSEYNDLPF